MTAPPEPGLKWYARANEASFKPTAGGYVFQAPSPWIFARPRYYVVSEAQKAQLLAGLGRWRLLLIAAMVANFALVGSIMLLMQWWPATFARPLVPLAQSLGSFGFILLLFAVFALMTAPVLAMPQVYLAGVLRAGLVGAPLTDERIRISDQLPKIATSVSRTVLAVGLIAGSVLIVSSLLILLDGYLEGHLLRGALQMIPALLFGALLTAYFVYLLRLRARQKQAAALLDV